MIYKINEGQLLRYGINWRIDKFVELLIILMFPISMPSKLSLYEDWYSESVYCGRHIKVKKLRLRITRRLKLYLSSDSFYEPIQDRVLIITREELEDNSLDKLKDITNKEPIVC
jgi:hypothetical protein